MYETLLKPYIAQHETEIDRKIMELRARAWDFFIFYFHNFAQVLFFPLFLLSIRNYYNINDISIMFDEQAGQSTLIQAFQYVLAQSVRFSAAANQPVPTYISLLYFPINITLTI